MLTTIANGEREGVATFPCITGWGVRRKTLPLEWRQVDWSDRMVRLEPSLSAMGMVGYKTGNHLPEVCHVTLVCCAKLVPRRAHCRAQPSRHAKPPSNKPF